MRALARRGIVTAVAGLIALLLPWSASPATASGASGPVVFPGDPVPVQIPDSLSGTLVDVAPDGSTKLAGAGKAGPAASVLTLLMAAPYLINAGCWISGHVMSTLSSKTTDCKQGASELGLGWVLGPDGDAPAATATYRVCTVAGSCADVGPSGADPASYVPGDLLVNLVASSTAGPFPMGQGLLATCLRPNGTTVTGWAYSDLENPFDPSYPSLMYAGCANPGDTSTPTRTINGYPAAAQGRYLDLCGHSEACQLVSLSWWDGIASGQGKRRGTWQSKFYQPRTITYTATCSNGTTTNTQTVTVEWNAVPGATSPSPQMTPCEQAYPGSHLMNLSGSYGPKGAPPTVTFSQPTFTTAATTAYPLCTTKAPAGGCWLDLRTPAGVSCFAKNVYCAGWANDTTGWKCSWGPYNMAISMCLAEYGTSFDAQPAPAPGATPGVYPGWDPNPNPNPSTGPSGSPSPSPTGGGVPTTGPNPETPPGDSTVNDPHGNPEGAGCMGGFWSFNPVAWVELPVKCALKWAYLPGDGVVQEQIDLLRTQAETRAPFSVAVALGTAVSGVAGGYAGAGGCGLLADFSSDDIEAPITCAQIRAVPGYGGLYALVSAGIYAATALALYRLFASYFESNSG